MITRHPCPVSGCTWFHESAVTASLPDFPADILSWTPLDWAFMGERIDGGLTDAQVVDAHLATHSPFQWMAELSQMRARAEDAEAERDRLRDAQQQTADVIAAVHPVTSMWLPSRAEVEATDLWRPAVAVDMTAGAVNGGGGNA